MSVIVSILVLALETAPSTCGTAALSGDEAVVGSLREELGRRGVAVISSEGAATIVVYVAQTPLGLQLEIHDHQGRATERSVANVTTGAALVESWLRSDLTSPLLMARAQAPAPPAAVVIEEKAEATLTVAAESALATDGSLWGGATVGGCVRFGSLCAGLVVRGAYDLGRRASASLDGASVRELRRTSAAALITVDRPIGLGPLLLIPGVGAGGEWMVTNASLGDRDGNVARAELAAQARVTMSFPLGRALAIDLGVTAAATPFAHRSAFQQDGFTLPGNALGSLRLGLGLSRGRP